MIRMLHTSAVKNQLNLGYFKIKIEYSQRYSSKFLIFLEKLLIKFLKFSLYESYQET